MQLKLRINEEIEKTKKHIDLSVKLGAKIFRVFGGWIKRESN